MILSMKKTMRYVIPYGLQCQQHAEKQTMSEKPVLYADEASPPVRFVMMTASLLDIELIVNKVDLFTSEQKTEEYYKINPLQKVPALVIGDKTILDSHAAAIYLCQKTSAQDLYPIDPLERAKVNEMLFYNSGRLFPLDSEIISCYFAGNWPVPETKKEEWYRALDYLEINLNKNNWLVGDKMYLCDVCVMLTVTSLQLLIPITERHRNVKQWLKRFEALPCYEINRQGLERLTHFIELFRHKE
ncbi:glutathione S-transferase E14-like [Colias croceus]|uniref:glutathione S-transferase E14-like n=1 Tax=Colias crocea TaxID=72248 RepID=UPI001E27B179|nr:glutathione S-transferase E14-like [Colias croceus]